MAEEKKEVELTRKGEEFKIRPGAYHRATGIPQGEKIPMKRIEADIKKGGKIGRMARSAKGLKAMHHKGESRYAENGEGRRPPRGKWVYKKGKWAFIPEKGKAEGYDANGYPYYLSEKEHPGGKLGTVKGHKTTAKQQKLFGIAHGMKKGQTPSSYSPQAAEIAGSMSKKETHKIASKPKGGYRQSPSESHYRMREADEAEERRLALARKRRLNDPNYARNVGKGIIKPRPTSMQRPRPRPAGEWESRQMREAEAKQRSDTDAPERQKKGKFIPGVGYRGTGASRKKPKQDTETESRLMQQAEERVMQMVHEEEERQERERKNNGGVPFKKRIPVGDTSRVKHPHEAPKTSQKGKPTWFGSGHRSSTAPLVKKGGD